MTEKLHPPPASEPAETLSVVGRRRFLRLVGLLPVILGLPVRSWAAAAEFCTVRKGETLSHLAQQHGVTVAQLRTWNDLKGDLIRPGQRLRIRPRMSARYPRLAGLESRIRLPRQTFSRWRRIIGHHSATASGNAAKFDAYHRRTRLMENGLGYHFLIGNGSDSGDGQIEIGTRWTRQIQGGHVRSLEYNEDSIGICLVGNFEVTRPTPKQLAAFTELVKFLRQEVLPKRPEFLVHRELKGERTLCPGKLFPVAQMHQLFG
ncbi:MAG: N-acetylmuramoyl-L-alanine amidase [Limisphaerales bacterium]